MAETQTQAGAAETRTREMSEFDRLLTGGVVTYTPFAEQHEIKISPNIILKMLCKPTAAGHYPGDQEVRKFQMLCMSRQLNPFEGDAYLVGYDSEKKGPTFSIIVSIGALYKRAEANPQYDGIESGVIVEAAGQLIDREGDFQRNGDILMGGWARVHRKDTKYPTVERLNVASRQKKSPFWESDPAGQIVKCAEAGALRRAFPSQLGGMYVANELRLKPAEEAADPTPATRSIEDQVGDYCRRTGRSTAAAVSFYRGWRAVNPASDGETFLAQLTQGKFDGFIPAIPAREAPVETPEPAPVASEDADTIAAGNIMLEIEAEAAAQNVDPALFDAYVSTWTLNHRGATNRADLARELLEAVRAKNISWRQTTN